MLPANASCHRQGWLNIEEFGCQFSRRNYEISSNNNILVISLYLHRFDVKYKQIWQVADTVFGEKIIDDRIKTGFTGFTNKSNLPIFHILPFLTNTIIIRSYRAISYV